MLSFVDKNVKLLLAYKVKV